MNSANHPTGKQTEQVADNASEQTSTAETSEKTLNLGCNPGIMYSSGTEMPFRSDGIGPKQHRTEQNKTKCSFVIPSAEKNHAFWRCVC